MGVVWIECRSECQWICSIWKASFAYEESEEDRAVVAG